MDSIWMMIFTVCVSFCTGFLVRHLAGFYCKECDERRIQDLTEQ